MAGDEATIGGLPEWLIQFDVRTVSLAPPHGGGGTEVRFWTDRPLAAVVAHFADRSGERGDEDDAGRHVWSSDRLDGSLRRLRTMVVESAPGPGAPAPPSDAVTIVWVSDLAVPSDQGGERSSQPESRVRRRWWRRS